jgi:hypothetical protein
MCVDAPDTTKQQEAAMLTAQLSEEQLAWAKEIYADTAPDRAEARRRANEISDLQMAQMRKAEARSDELQARYDATYLPVEKSIVADAMDYDSQARKDAAAGEAVADVTQAYSNARDQGARSLQRMGVNPNDGRYAQMTQQTDSAQALAQAQAANQARKQVETQGWARRMDAAGLGRGVVSSQATQAGMASQMGTSALNAGNSAMGAGMAGVPIVQGGYQTAIGGMGQAANIYGDINRQQMAAQQSNAGMWGSLIGAGGNLGAAYLGTL